MYCFKHVTEVIKLLEEFNNKNELKEYSSYVHPYCNYVHPYYNNYKIIFEGSNANRFSNCCIKMYDDSMKQWRNICSYVRSAGERKYQYRGSIGLSMVSACSITPSNTQRTVRSFLIDSDDIDSEMVEIEPGYDDHENIESFLFQKSVLSKLEYDSAIKIYLVNCISTNLRFGEASLYDNLYSMPEEELKIIINILTEALNVQPSNS